VLRGGFGIRFGDVTVTSRLGRIVYGTYARFLGLAFVLGAAAAVAGALAWPRERQGVYGDRPDRSP
jgi:hypothetical protein